MGIKDVFVIFDKKRYDKKMILRDFDSEGYPFNFHFGDGEGLPVYKCKEVWTFGRCSDDANYQIAVQSGADLWKMGE